MDRHGKRSRYGKMTEDSEGCAMGCATPLDVRGRTVGLTGERNRYGKVTEDSEGCAIGCATPLDVRGRTVG